MAIAHVGFAGGGNPTIKAFLIAFACLVIIAVCVRYLVCGRYRKRKLQIAGTPIQSPLYCTLEYYRLWPHQLSSAPIPIAPIRGPRFIITATTTTYRRLFTHAWYRLATPAVSFDASIIPSSASISTATGSSIPVYDNNGWIWSTAPCLQRYTCHSSSCFSFYCYTSSSMLCYSDLYTRTFSIDFNISAHGWVDINIVHAISWPFDCPFDCPFRTSSSGPSKRLPLD